MYTIVNEMSAGKYNVLFLDNEIPLKPFNSVIIDSEIFGATLPNDLPNAITIQSNKSYKGKQFRFAMIYE